MTPKHSEQVFATHFKVVIPVKEKGQWRLVTRIEKFEKILGVAAILYRCIRKEKFLKYPTEMYSVEELKQVELALWREVQKSHYPEEFEILSTVRTDPQIPQESKILNLRPIFDSHRQVLVVGGRLKNSGLGHEAKHQIILPHGDELVRKLIHHIHVKNSHAPMRTTFNISRPGLGQDKFI